MSVVGCVDCGQVFIVSKARETGGGGHSDLVGCLLLVIGQFDSLHQSSELFGHVDPVQTRG